MERRVLAALAASKPDSISTSALVGVLWPANPPRSANKVVQTNVLRLRTLLGASTILTTEHGYRLADDVDVDADRFERAFVEARSSSLWDPVLAMAGGVPFDDLSGWPLAEARRARVEELHRSALEYRLEALLDGGVDEDLVPELESLVSAEPLREKRWCLLVRALKNAGRRAEALRAVARARSVLVAELGVEPGRELASLYESLLAEGDGVVDEPHRGDALVISDRLYAEARAAQERGDQRAAVLAYCRSGHLARASGDARRLALAALGAAGDGWTTGLDATDDVVSLLLDAAALVPKAPTPTRSKLLSRLAITRSYHRTQDAGERDAQAALAIARTLDEPELEARALHALVVVVDDPTRVADRSVWLDALMRLADAHPDQPWRRWALPLAASLAALEGDVARAASLLDELTQLAVTSGDRVATYAAAHRRVLAASIAGDWPQARQAVADVQVAGEAAHFDPTAARLEAFGVRPASRLRRSNGRNRQWGSRFGHGTPTRSHAAVTSKPLRRRSPTSCRQTFSTSTVTPTGSRRWASSLTPHTVQTLAGSRRQSSS
jgi:DNA-binding SARP family transcriptional activator